MFWISNFQIVTLLTKNFAKKIYPLTFVFNRCLCTDKVSIKYLQANKKETTNRNATN